MRLRWFASVALAFALGAFLACQTITEAGEAEGARLFLDVPGETGHPGRDAPSRRLRARDLDLR